MAARALVRVLRDDAFAAAALDAEIERAPQLDPRDRGFATELVYGTLRVLPWLTTRIDAHAKRPLAKQPHPVRAALLLAAYQLHFARVPAFAAVDAAVGSVRAELGREVGGFTNAVLRKVAADAATRAGDAGLRGEALFASCPAWLRTSLERALGGEGARAFLAADEPPIGLRVRPGADREAALAELSAHDPAAAFSAGKVSPLAILAQRAGNPRALPGVASASSAERRLAIQEEGSQVVALALGARPGETVLDACAGRGNKTALLCELVGPTGAVDACDLHEPKLERLTAELASRGTPVRATHAVDWSVGVGDVPEGYDRVLVDAPCSGVGTLRRRPDLLLRRQERTIAELAALQGAILRRVATRVRPGGVLVYAVCSVLDEESRDVVERFLAETPEFERAPVADEEVAAVPGFSAGESALRLTPAEHGTDGYHLVRLRRVAKPPLGA